MTDHPQEIPKGWAVATLGELTVPKVDQGPPSLEPVPYIDISSIDRYRKEIGELRRVDAGTAPTRARQWVKAGDVLVSMTRPNLNAVALVPRQLEGAVASTGFDVLRAIAVVPGWILSRVRSHAFVQDVCGGLKGVVYPAIRPHDVRGHQLPIPPLDEQRRIIEFLDSYFTRLDDAMATLERVQRNLKRYRASVLKAAVEGRLVPTEAELARKERRDYESADVLLARILEERKARWIEHEAEKGRAKAAGKAAKAGKPWTEADDQAALVKARTAAVTKYKEPAPPDTSKLPELPEGWSWTTLEALTSPERVICYGILMPKEHVPDGVPYVKVRDMRSGVLDVPNLPRTSLDIDAKYARSRLRAGDLLLAIRGTWGRVVEIPPELEGGNITQDSARLALHTDLNRRYFKYAILSDTIQRYFSRVARGVAVKGVNIGDVRLAPVPLPPIAEQERVAVYVDDMLSLEAAVEQSVVADTSRCARLRQSILKWAFEGKLVDQDPNDEPASLLLDRIKAERDTAQAAAKAKKKPARKPRKKKSA